METRNKQTECNHIIWIYTGNLQTSLDAATWIETTKHLRSFGWQVTLIAVGKKGKRHYRGVEIYCMPMPDVYLLGQFMFHLSVIKELYNKWRSIDIVLFHEMSALWILPVRILVSILTKRKRPKFVMDTRTLFMQPEINNTIKDKIRLLYYKSMAKTANRYVDGRLTITNEMAKVCNVPKEKLWGVWPSGVDPKPFSMLRRYRKWPILNDRIILIYIGSLHYERNLLTLSHAVNKVNKSGKRFELLIYGEGTQEEELKEYSKSSGDSIKVFSSIPHDEIPLLLNKAHIGVLPFPDEEKFRVSSPIKLFEYMASGMPILATRIQCHTNVIEQGNYVFWAEHSKENSLINALEEIWVKRQQLSSMGEASTNAVNSWTWLGAANKLSFSLKQGFEKMTLIVD